MECVMTVILEWWALCRVTSVVMSAQVAKSARMLTALVSGAVSLLLRYARLTRKPAKEHPQSTDKRTHEGANKGTHKNTNEGTHKDANKNTHRDANKISHKGTNEVAYKGTNSNFHKGSGGDNNGQDRGTGHQGQQEQRDIRAAGTDQGPQGPEPNLPPPPQGLPPPETPPDNGNRGANNGNRFGAGRYGRQA